MTNIKDYTCRICIVHNANICKLFSLGYYKDGGYFITDLGVETFNYLAMKVSTKEIDKNTAWTCIPWGNMNVFSIQLNKPKISHHIDGKSHISGKNITSGYFENGKSKGLSVKAFDLRGDNDGGPVFGCAFRADQLFKFKNIPISRIEEEGQELLKKSHLIIPTSSLFLMKEPFYYVVEGYYIHKSDLPSPDKMNKNPILWKNHPEFGIISLCAIVSPDSSPYVFGISLRKEICSSKGSFILSFGACPGSIGNDGNWDILTLMVTEEDLPISKTSLDRIE